MIEVVYKSTHGKNFDAKEPEENNTSNKEYEYNKDDMYYRDYYSKKEGLAPNPPPDEEKNEDELFNYGPIK